MNSKKKGTTYEIKIRLELRDRFYPGCETSRYASKMTDDAKVDFVNTGRFNIQAKATEKAPNFQETLASMPVDNRINAVFHKRNRQGEVVVMDKKDFYEILGILQALKVAI
jgi:hypothetical protein